MVPIQEGTGNPARIAMQRLRRALRDQRGFTLSEVMITLGIFGILMAIAVPSIQQQISRQQLTGSARELRAVLRDSRSAAINEGVPRYVLLQPGTPASYRRFRYDGSAWVAEGGAIPLKGRVGFSADDVSVPGVSNAPVAGTSVPADAIYFDTRGRYPFGFSGSYRIRLSAQMSDPVILTFYPQTGQVTGP